MKYQKVAIESRYSEFVECMFIWDGYTQDEIEIESPPSAYGSIVFNYGDSYSISNCRYQKKKVPTAFIMGQAIRNYTLHVKNKVGMAGIVFKPSGLFHYFGIPMYELTEERVELEKVLPDTKTFLDDLSQQGCKSGKLKILNGVLQKMSTKKGHSLPSIVQASNKLLQSKGGLSVDELLKDIFMSRRCFERHFLEHVGVSPKAYAKLRRFGYTCSLLAGKRKVNLSKVLFKGGYYDQSHFIKDFKYFAGRTPKFYVENNQELAHLIREHELVSS